jgi:FMN phosphatase YigB (HAD superfamily)
LPTDKFKSGSLLKDCGVFENFIKEKIRNGFKIYLIKDEAHRETSNLNELGKHFSKIFNFSATPKHKPDVEITEENAVKFHLIKDLRRWNTKTITNEEESIKELKKALDLFYKNDNDGIKRKYEKFLPKFNPAFMIQISNKNKADNEINMIKKCLSEYSADIQYVILSNDTKHQETNNKELLKSSRNM